MPPDVFLPTGKLFETIKKIMEKEQTLSDLQKQTLQPVIREQPVYLLSVLHSCI